MARVGYSIAWHSKRQSSKMVIKSATSKMPIMAAMLGALNGNVIISIMSSMARRNMVINDDASRLSSYISMARIEAQSKYIIFNYQYQSQ
jgi:hypothetical protein